MTGKLYFLWHKANEHLADGPFVYATHAQEARRAYPFGDDFDIVEISLPVVVSKYN